MICGKCSIEHNRVGPNRPQSKCEACHAKYMREWRKTHKLTPEQRVKDNARSYAQVYEKRGLLLKLPCQTCGDEKSEKHHEDYSKPLAITWLCRKCHLALHQKQK